MLCASCFLYEDVWSRGQFRVKIHLFLYLSSHVLWCGTVSLWKKWHLFLTGTVTTWLAITLLFLLTSLFTFHLVLVYYHSFRIQETWNSYIQGLLSRSLLGPACKFSNLGLHLPPIRVTHSLQFIRTLSVLAPKVPQSRKLAVPGKPASFFSLNVPYSSVLLMENTPQYPLVPLKC